MSSDLLRTAAKVRELARPRASVGAVAFVVLLGELIAITLVWAATTLPEGSLDSLVVTLAVVAAAIAALVQVARSAGTSAEPGHRWLVAAWVVVAALAADSMGSLPLGLTENPAGSAGLDQALWQVLLWTLALAVGVLGADARPDARRMPFVVVGSIGVVGVVGALFLEDRAFVTRTGATDTYVLLSASVLAVSLFAVIRWLFRWKVRGGWSLTWSGTGLVLGTLGVVMQLAADLGNERIWAASTGLLVSSLLVPGLGALVAGGAIAGAHTLARRELKEGLREADGTIPLLEVLDVELTPVASLAKGATIGSLADAVLPVSGMDADWWRAQATTLGLAGRLEAALATRAIDAVAREDEANWVVVPIAAEAVGPELLSALTDTTTGTLVVVLRGPQKAIIRALPRLRDADITCGIWVRTLEARTLDGLGGDDVSLLVLPGHIVHGVAVEPTRRRRLADLVRHADRHSVAVMVDKIVAHEDVAVLAEVGVRYVAGDPAVVEEGLRAVPPRIIDLDHRGGLDATPEPENADVLDIIEAAGLRDSQGQDRT